MSTTLLTGDLDGLNPRLRMRLERLARRIGRPIKVTSGGRTTEEQRYLYEHRDNPAIVPSGMAAPPGSSLHEGGYAADAYIDGVPIFKAVSAADLRAVGLYAIGVKDDMHVQLYPVGTSLADARAHSFVRDQQEEWRNRGTPLDPVADAAGAVKDHVEDGVSAAARATANAVVDVFAGWAKTDGLRALLAVVLVAGGLVLMTIGVSRAAGARREVTT